MLFRSPAALSALDPALYIAQQDAIVGVLPSPQVLIAGEADSGAPPQGWIIDPAGVLLCALAGAAAGYGAVLFSRRSDRQPAVAMLGVGGNEEAAKRAWLARLDAPVRGNNEEAAKRAWLAKLDAPAWGQAAAALAGVASEAAKIADMTAACDQGDDVACDNLSREEEAKRAAIFADNVDFINAHNAKWAKGESTFNMGVNAHCDLSHDEFKARFIGPKIAERKVTNQIGRAHV